MSASSKDAHARCLTKVFARLAVCVHAFADPLNVAVQVKVRYIKPPAGLLSKDPKVWEMVAQLAASAEQREAAPCSKQQRCTNSADRSASSSASSAAARKPCLEPCHKVVTAPESGIQQHTIVTASASSLEEYATLQKAALNSQSSKQRSIIITPVSKDSDLAPWLLRLAGLQDWCFDVLLVSQHFFGISTSKLQSEQLFQEIQQDIHSSLTEEHPVAISSQKLSGFVQLQGPTVLISLPQTCSRLADINFSHISAVVHPKPLKDFSKEQMEALIRTAVPACQHLLALPGLPTWSHGVLEQSPSVLDEEEDLASCMRLLNLSKSEGIHSSSGSDMCVADLCSRSSWSQLMPI